MIDAGHTIIARVRRSSSLVHRWMRSATGMAISVRILIMPLQSILDYSIIEIDACTRMTRLSTIEPNAVSLALLALMFSVIMLFMQFISSSIQCYPPLCKKCALPQINIPS